MSCPKALLIVLKHIRTFEQLEHLKRISFIGLLPASKMVAAALWVPAPLATSVTPLR